LLIFLDMAKTGTYGIKANAHSGIIEIEAYAALDFANDAAAATGGVPLGGIYHNSGDLKVRVA
jgi:hypothetical protein